MRKADWLALSQYLSSLRVGSRDMDLQLYEAMDYPVKGAPERKPGNLTGWTAAWQWRNLDTGRWESMGNLTTSIGDAIRFIERHGAQLAHLAALKDRPCKAEVLFPLDQAKGMAKAGTLLSFGATGKQLPLALMAAFCRAKSQEIDS